MYVQRESVKLEDNLLRHNRIPVVDSPCCLAVYKPRPVAPLDEVSDGSRENIVHAILALTQQHVVPEEKCRTYIRED